MRSALPSLLLAAACGASRPAVPAEGDAIVFQRILDGTLPASDGLAQVAASGGWPISTSAGWLFAIADNGNGPFQISSPSGAFAPVTMRTESGVAWAIIPIAAPAGASYQLATRSGATFYDPLSRVFRYDSADQMSLVAAQGAHLERFFGIGDAGVSPRTIRVWVPAQTPTHFLYAHDGQNLFGGYPRTYGGWFLQDGAGPTTLIVGIDNSAARFAEYTPVTDVIGGSTQGGDGAAYADFVENTVRPFIEARYGRPQRTGVIGSSLGGVISYFQVLRHSQTWDFAASLSGTMGWGSIGPGVHNATIIDQFGALSACPAAVFYLDSGGGPGAGCADSDDDGIRDDTPDASDNYCENAQLLEVMQAKGCDVHYTWASGAQHNEAAWRARAPAVVALFESL
ncbi:MAG TPA: alpha/beta hydrolase-fold protein [Myxococcales bacterium]|nr:alpha/beta hydrolase-fold protein [Myxococcales bacterium]